MSWKASSSFIIPILCTEDDKGNCYAEYDSIDSLTPNLPKPEQTPYETPNDTPKQSERVLPDLHKIYTWYCEDDLTDHSRISTWYALEYLLLISCMPTDPAKDIWYDVQ